MPIAAQKPVTVQVNAVYAWRIEFLTRIVGGKLKTGANIYLRGANATADDVWTDGGTSNLIAIPDVESLPSDLQPIALQAGMVYTQLVQLIAAMNAIRKLV